MAQRRSTQAARRARRIRKQVAIGVGVVSAVAVGGAAAQARKLADPAFDPIGEGGFDLPPGVDLTVTTDDGASLAVTVAGPDDGPTVVLPHCWLGSRQTWAPVARRLVASGHRVVLYDQRGHGLSTIGDHGTTVKRLGHDLHTVVSQLAIARFVAGGHSMGGMTIQAYAAELPHEAAARLQGIALVSTAAHVLRRPVPARAINAALGDGAMRAVQRARLGNAVVRGAVGKAAYPAHLQATLDGLLQTSTAARAGFMVDMSRMDLRSGLASISAPTAVLVGSRDTLTPPRLAKVLATSIPGARLEVLPGLGHMLPFEAPDVVAATLAELAAGAQPGAPANQA